MSRIYVLALIALSAVSPSFADETSEGALPPFSYYEVILERKPFGDLAKPNAGAPEMLDQAAIEQAKEEQALARQIDMVAVNRTPRGKIAVGFIDKGEKPPRNYYLNVGDSSGGFTVLEADFSEETATIEKDGVSIALKLGKGMIPKKTEGEEEQTAAVTPPSPPPPAVPSTRPNMPPNRPGLVRPAAKPESNAALPRGSYMDKIRARQANKDAQNRASAEEIAKLREEVNKAAQTSKEEAAQRERKINLELISRGQEPLSPIELTPEEDAELVRKGVFTEAQ